MLVASSATAPTLNYAIQFTLVNNKYNYRFCVIGIGFNSYEDVYEALCYRRDEIFRRYEAMNFEASYDEERDEIKVALTALAEVIGAVAKWKLTPLPDMTPEDELEAQLTQDVVVILECFKVFNRPLLLVPSPGLN